MTLATYLFKLLTFAFGWAAAIILFMALLGAVFGGRR